jgi:hypothetical protein
LIPDLEKGIEKTEEQLEAAKMTAYDYGAVQKRAGEILLAQESVQKIKDLPDEEVEYLQSLPEAFKYEGQESLKRHGPMGVYVDSVMKTMKGKKEKKSWPDLLAGLKENSKGDEKLYKRGVSMMASRILRATREAQGIEKAKGKAMAKAMPPRPRDLWLTRQEEYGEPQGSEPSDEWLKVSTLPGIESGPAPESEILQKKRRKKRRRKRK